MMQTEPEAKINQGEIIKKILSGFNQAKTQTNGSKETGANAEGKGLQFIRNFFMRPSDLMAHLESKVIKQKEAIRIMSTSICGHYNSIRRRLEKGENPMNDLNRIKSNILLMGSTGIGKTFILKLLAEKIGVPYIKVDATKFTEAGYVGGDVEDIIRDLADKTKDKEGNVDIEMTEYGIVFIDESDKIASSGGAANNDVSKRGVQQALLTIIEEADVKLKQKHDIEEQIKTAQRIQMGQKIPKKKPINTRNILFIFSGAFPGLDEIVSKRMNKTSIGFESKLKKEISPEEVFKNVKTEDLIKFGFEPEFIGRIPIKVTLESLSENDLLSILKHPNSPIITKFKEEMESYGISAELSDEVLEMVAKEALKEKTGARGLLAAFCLLLSHYETYLPDIEVPHGSNLPICFTKQMVDGTIDPILFVDDLKKLFQENLEATQTEIERKTIDQDSILGYIDYIQQKYNLSLTFNDNLKELLVYQTKDDGITPRKLCEKLFNQYEYAFKILVDNGKTDLEITEASIANPMRFLENAISK